MNSKFTQFRKSTLIAGAFSLLNFGVLLAQQTPNVSQETLLNGLHNPKAVATITAEEIREKGRQSQINQMQNRTGDETTSFVLDFEGLGDLDAVLEFYNGGTSEQGFSGVNYGISFSNSALALIDSDAGGTGNFANEPSESTILAFLGEDPILNLETGFTTGFSFFYVSPTASGSVAVYDGLNGTGNLLNEVALPTLGVGVGDPNGGDFGNWMEISIPFTGVAYSIVFSGAANYTAFDDITFGSVEAGVVDYDGDGFNNTEDCDDFDASVYPGAPEIANDGIDQDCDGEDLVIEVVCPTPTNVQISTTATSVTSWCDADPLHLGYDLETTARPSSRAVYTGIPNWQDVASPFTVTRLAPNYNYSFRVRADCSGDDSNVSEWAGPFDFSTPAFTARNNAELANNVLLSPNPAKSVVKIEAKDQQFVKVEIISFSGIMVAAFDLNSNQFDVQSLPTGRYMIKLYDTEGNISVEKLIKK